MTTLPLSDRALTLDQLGDRLREAVKDKSYQATQIGTFVFPPKNSRKCSV